MITEAIPPSEERQKARFSVAGASMEAGKLTRQAAHRIDSSLSRDS
jgi:hypothetical protein